MMGRKRILTRDDLPFDAVFPDIKDGKCRMCGKILTGKQMKWCSQRCSLDAFSIVMMRRGSSTHIRKFILDRDKGICANCGCDTEKLLRIHRYVTKTLVWNWGLSVIDERWKEITGWPVAGTYWEADHVLEVCNGGEHTPENLQTLCIKCHKLKTAELKTKGRPLLGFADGR